MTARQVYEGVLIEMNKVNAPSLLLEDFNYLFNKAIYQYVNKKYNVYDTNQQSTDDVRVLKATAILNATKGGLGQSDLYNRMEKEGAGSAVTALGSLYGATYDVNLPDDYLHLLNCICVYKVNKPFKCYDAGNYVQFAATRLTADAWANVINNFYMRPSYKKPYYYIHNVNTSHNVPTNPYDPEKPIIEGSGSAGSAGFNKITFVAGGAPITISANGINGASQVTFNGIEVTASNFKTLFGSKPDIVYRNTDNTTVVVLSTTEPPSSERVSVSYIKEATSTASASANANGTDANGMYHVTDYLGEDSGTISNFPRTFNLGDNLSGSLVEKPATHRYGNTSKVRMEIRYGKDTTLFELVQVYVDYIKVPQYIRLTQEEIDLTEDTSQMMEFPDYVCQEIINELTKLLMENSSDQRLQTNMAVNQTIGQPAQQQAPQQ